MNALLDKLLEKMGGRRDSAPVFRIRQQSISEMEDRALKLISRLDEGRKYEKTSLDLKRGRSSIVLPDGGKASVFHASGALHVSTGLAPMERLIDREPDRTRLTGAAMEAAKRLDLFGLADSGESLEFERLWLIKAAGMNHEGARGETVVCRAVGAFRRYIDELPVWGRASAFVELAGSDSISGAGVDWRPISDEKIDQVKLIDPERAASAVVSDLQGRLPGAEFSAKSFEVTMFSLGYMSRPKRQEQSLFAPVYVALLERKGWTSMSYAVVVAGSEVAHEPLCRTASQPPSAAIQVRSRPERSATEAQ